MNFDIKLTKRQKEVITWLRKGERYYINPTTLRHLWAKKLLTWDEKGTHLTSLGKTIKL